MERNNFYVDVLLHDIAKFVLVIKQTNLEVIQWINFIRRAIEFIAIVKI